MKTLSCIAVAGLTLTAFLQPAAAGQPETADLKVGDQAPKFELQGSDGRTYRLSDFTGKSAVVLAWFPKAFTGG